MTRAPKAILHRWILISALESNWTRRMVKPAILIVEDEPSQREILCYNLEAEGYEVYFYPVLINLRIQIFIENLG